MDKAPYRNESTEQVQYYLTSHYNGHIDFLFVSNKFN